MFADLPIRLPLCQMSHMPVRLSPVALLITDMCASASCRRTCCGFLGFHYRQTASTLSERRHRQSWSRVPVCLHLSSCAWTLCMPRLPIVLRRRAQGCFSLFFFRYKNFSSSSIGCLVRSSLVTSSSALPNSCQPRPDATLTESVQFDDFIQLSRGSFAASV